MCAIYKYGKSNKKMLFLIIVTLVHRHPFCFSSLNMNSLSVEIIFFKSVHVNVFVYFVSEQEPDTVWQ